MGERKAGVQAVGPDFYHSSSSGGGEKCSDSGYIQVDTKKSLGGLSVGCMRKTSIKK